MGITNFVNRRKQIFYWKETACEHIRMYMRNKINDG